MTGSNVFQWAVVLVNLVSLVLWIYLIAVFLDVRRQARRTADCSDRMARDLRVTALLLRAEYCKRRAIEEPEVDRQMIAYDRTFI